jgi:adenine-specific DNA-methyltransferase
LLDEIFGQSNFFADIIFVKAGALGSVQLPRQNDYIIWYCKNKNHVKYNQLYFTKVPEEDVGAYQLAELPSGEIRGLKATDDLSQVRPLRYVLMTKPGPGQKYSFDFQGRPVDAGDRWWGFPPESMPRLIRSGRIAPSGRDSKRYLNDFPATYLSNLWTDTATGSGMGKVYVVQTNEKVVERCLLMCTDPGDLVLDPTCGSGTSAVVSERWGRRWITCDTSRVAITLAKQRLMTASFDYFALRYPHEGLQGGFIYGTVPHITLKSIANNPDIDEIYKAKHPNVKANLQALNIALNAFPPGPFTPTQGYRKGKAVVFTAGQQLEEWEVPFDFPDGWPKTAEQPFWDFHAARQTMQVAIDQSIKDRAERETLYDKPEVDRSRLRITGPFSVEAVPAPTVLSLEEQATSNDADVTVARSGETSRQAQWRDELIRTGIRAKGGAMLKFADLEAIPGVKYLHASGTLDSGERVVVSFGPEHAALEQKQVERAIGDAQTLIPKPKFVVFCAFTFDPEAAKDIDELNWPGVTLLKAQMNIDLLTQDLKKARSSNQSFWLMGQPEVELKQVGDNWQVEIHGFDYFDPREGTLVSGGKSKIAMWSLDTDYDGRSLMPHQVFFPMAGAKDGWNRLKKTIRAELDEELLEQFHGTVSLPFEAGDHRRVAVKIVDDRGIESLKIMNLE